MSSFWLAGALAAPLVLFGVAYAGSKSDEEKIKEAMSAAPAAVGANATIMVFDDDGSMRMVREGSNGFTCMSDDPTPGHNPMCLDANAMLWAEAWMSKTEPPKGKVGFGYMLAGGGTPSNIDPYATEPPAGRELMLEPPHVMIFSLPEAITGYPGAGTEDYDASQPWVMWAGTPYEHLMLPVE